VTLKPICGDQSLSHPNPFSIYRSSLALQLLPASRCLSVSVRGGASRKTLTRGREGMYRGKPWLLVLSSAAQRRGELRGFYLGLFLV